MDKNLLEFWGQAFLNAARSQQQMEDFNKLIGLNVGPDNPFYQSFIKAFGFRKPEQMTTTDADGNFVPAIYGAYYELTKAYLRMFNFIPAGEYLKLEKENVDLKKKIAGLEQSLMIHNNLFAKDNFGQQQVVDNFTKIMKNQTQDFQNLMKKLNQHYKKAATMAKK